MQLVQAHTLAQGNAADWLAAAALLGLVLLAVAYTRARPGYTAGTYYPAAAWQRAGMYFCAALILSWSLGVLQSLLTTPLLDPVPGEDPLWAAFTLFYLVVLWMGYAIIWPRGTFSDGRRSHPLLTTIYGLLWGLCHGQVFLCIWALAELSGISQGWVALVTFLILSGYNFAFQQYFWDIQVSPPHNIAAWNPKKVLYCHVPNLVLGLTWLAIWGNFGLWLLLQTAVLLISAHVMRFPAWYDDYRGIPGQTR